ncbi:MAG: PAS domain S-box protein [Bacteroidia bacterium]
MKSDTKGLDNRESDLYDGEGRFREYLDLAKTIFVALDLNLTIEAVNSRCSELLGYLPEELCKKKELGDIVVTKDKPYVQTILNEWAGSNSSSFQNYECGVITKSGEERLISWNCTRIKNREGSVTGILSSGEDITERTSAYEKVKESEERFRTLVETMDEGVMTVDNDDVIKFVNKKYCEITGYSSDFLIGQKASELLLDTTYKEHLERIINEREEGGSSQYEIPIRAKSGDYKWLLISGCPLYDKLGNVVGSIGVHTDITSRKEIEMELIKAKDKALDSSRAKEVFFANMSHEIRTPMNGIVGLTSLLIKTPLERKQMEYLSAIQKSANHLLVIIDDILDFSKIEAGKVEMDKISFDLYELLDTSIKILDFKAQEKGLSIEKFIEPDVPRYVVGDPARMNQILTNLLGNAVKFTEGGHVMIKVSFLQEKNDKIELLFQITDTGIGIPAEMQTKIFESFVQANSGISGRFGGTGLGLSIVKSLVERFGGHISVFSKENEGTTFTFTLQLGVSNKHAMLNENNEPVEERPLGINVLVAEDNSINQLLINEVLKQWDCIIDIAENGLIAVEKHKANCYDIILMDIQMPEMNGIDATKFIRTQMDNPKSTIPIIALTAHATEKEKITCMDAGVNEYITKPFEPANLYKKIVKLTGV